jgi:lysophospholipase L1-like esterase
MNRKKLMLLATGLAILIAASGATSLFMLSIGSKDRVIRVACVGDSITGGTEYPAELWMQLGANYTVGNFGVSGSTASMNSTKPYMNESAFQDAKDFKPDIVIIMLGTNDANPTIRLGNDSFVGDYVKLVEAFKALSSKPQVYLVKPPPVFCNGTTPNAATFRDNVIPTIEQAANQANVPLIDVYSALADSSNYFPDGVHPDGQGAVLIANQVSKAITSRSS